MDRLKKELNLSSITLGTMRYLDKGMQTNQVTHLIDKAFEQGIDTHHSSFEYNSYDLYIKALHQSSKRNNIKHIVKLSSPHFEEDKFSAQLLEKKIDKQLLELKTDTIDVLQWLIRSKPINDVDRIKILNTQKLEITECLQNLKGKGKIKSIFSFPYSVTFAEKVIQFEVIDGIISYLNTEEQEYSHFANKYPFIGIRPFYAGKSLKHKKIEECMGYIKKHNNIITTIVGINDIKQLDSFIKI